MTICTRGLFFKWHETFDRGEVSKVTCLNSKQEWKVSSRNSTDSKSTRIKFIVLGCFLPCYMVATKLPLRVYHLITGESIKNGRQLAREKWLNDPDRDNISLDSLTRKEIVFQIVKDIIKIVLLPFELIALEFSALVGIVLPYDGRKMFCDIEDFFASPFMRRWEDNPRNVLFRHNEYCAPCMQDTENFISKNLNKVHDADKYSNNQIEYRLKKKISRLSPFLRSVGVEVDKLKQDLKDISPEYIDNLNKNIKKLKKFYLKNEGFAIKQRLVKNINDILIQAKTTHELYLHSFFDQDEQKRLIKLIQANDLAAIDQMSEPNELGNLRMQVHKKINELNNPNLLEIIDRIYTYSKEKLEVILQHPIRYYLKERGVNTELLTDHLNNHYFSQQDEKEFWTLVATFPLDIQKLNAALDVNSHENQLKAQRRNLSVRISGDQNLSASRKKKLLKYIFDYKPEQLKELSRLIDEGDQTKIREFYRYFKSMMDLYKSIAK